MYRVPAYEIKTDQELEQLEAMQNAMERGLPEGEQGNAQAGPTGSVGDATSDWWELKQDEDATRMQLAAEAAEEEENARRLAEEELAAPAFELATQDREAQNDRDGSAESSPRTPGAACQVQAAGPEGTGSVPSEAANQHAGVAAPGASGSGVAGTNGAESAGAPVDDPVRSPGKGEPGEHGAADHVDHRGAPGDQPRAPGSAPAPAAAAPATGSSEPALRQILTWDTIRRDGVRWPPTAVVRQLGDRMATLLVKLVQCAAESSDGVVAYDTAFRRDGPQDASGHECNCFTPEGARFALRRLTEAALAGTYGQAMRAFVTTIRLTRISVDMSGEVVARAYGDLFRNEGGVSGHAGRDADRHAVAPPRQPAGGPNDGGRTAAPCGSGRKHDGAPPEGGMGSRAKKADVGAMAGPPAAKAAFPPLEIHVRPVEGRKGLDLKDPAQWTELPERLARDAYPLVPGYAGVKDLVILKELALQHLQEWLTFHVEKLATLLTAPDGPRKLGLMFCRWVERRSTFTFDYRGVRVPWLVSDLWSAARSHGYQARYGIGTCSSSGSTVDVVYVSAGMLMQEMREVVGGMDLADLAQRPELVFELGVDFVNVGTAIIDRLGLEVTRQQRRRLVVSSICCDELDRSVQAMRAVLAGTMVVKLRRGLMKARGRWRNPDGSINVAEFDRLASREIDQIRGMVAERFPPA